MKRHDLSTPRVPNKPADRPLTSIEIPQSSGPLNESLLASADLAAQEALLSISTSRNESNNPGRLFVKRSIVPS
jgi:hypothetical protein